MNRLKFPIGIANFQTIRTEGYYYVDKTPYIAQLNDHGKYFFLSRPRRFGKSLLISTLKHLFEGNEQLFRGLHIHDRWDWSITYPVVRLSFGSGYREPGKLESYVKNELAAIARSFGVPSELYSEESQDFLKNILRYLHETTGRQVVVLVDEYDKPILDAIDKPELAESNRDHLRDIYGVIKDSADQVGFVFVTGITMFSKVNLFSVLNNLINISIDPRYAAICGYTESDLETAFVRELQGLDRSEVRRWYNGYGWSGEDRVYNPYDILYLLDTRKFEAHWFMTGLPTFLYRLMLERQFTPLDMENLKVERDFVSKFDVHDISAEALLFQTGYLTIVGEQRVGTRTVYDLDYPNLEVRMYLNEGYVDHLFGPGKAALPQSRQLVDFLSVNDFDGFAAALRTVLSAIPYEWHNASDMASREGWYSSLLYACLISIGCDVRTEESTSRGRSDLVVLLDAQVFVFELKMVAQGQDVDHTAKDAIRQIREREYAQKYRQGTDEIFLIGAVFSAETRNLMTMKVERD